MNISNHNEALLAQHTRRLDFLKSEVNLPAGILQKLKDFQIAIPSWALGTGGTRFGRFSGGGEPRNLEEKIADVGLLHALNQSSGAISLHIPWDIPTDPAAIRTLAAQHGLAFDAVNSNTFQDQADQAHSYKFGSLQHVSAATRKQAIDHNIEVIKHGVELGSKALTVWLSDGSCFPGQLNFRHAYERTVDSLREIYAALPADWSLYLEYKAYEPNFYSTTVGDWGASYSMVNKLGPQAKTLVDLGHHLPNANIEQIVSILLMEGKLGGFHFNDSKYGDDDLDSGSINPHQLFLVFNELAEAELNPRDGFNPSYMIDQSHNVTDPIESMLSSAETITQCFAKACLVDREALHAAQNSNDTMMAFQALRRAYTIDVSPILAKARAEAGGAIDVLEAFRISQYRDRKAQQRKAVGLGAGIV